MERADVIVVGAGAAGLMASIACGRRSPGRRIVVLEGARRLGAKILVSGGGRCNVTHDVVSERDYCGSSPAAIRKVLRRFGVPETIAFFRDLGLDLVREEGGKLFPATGRARSVLDALLGGARAAGAEIRFPRRVERVTPSGSGALVVAGTWGEMVADRVILCAGGCALPKSGSDGSGHALARALGHSVTRLVFPALVPLVLPSSSGLLSLPGVACDARVEVRSATGRCLASTRGPVLCTHFGLSGPAILDISRHLIEARADDGKACLVVAWAPDDTPASMDAALAAGGGRAVGRVLARRMPERLARALCALVDVDSSTPAAGLPRAARRSLAMAATDMTLRVVSHRGFTHAETTAGGVPLREVRLETMESRLVPGLHLAGEILDVDGRLGGFNFQWAWSSGHVAGSAP